MKKNKVILLSAVLIIAAILGFFLYKRFYESSRRFQVTFFNIGQGDAALIKFGDGQKMLVDCGPDRKILSKLGRALPFYDRGIDYLLVTHPDLDHYGGCVDVLKNYQIREIITNGRKKEYDPYWRVWDRAAENEGAVLTIINNPQKRIIADSSLDFLSPDDSLGMDAPADDNNNYSIVFKLKNGRTSFLFTGDMEEPLEKALVHKYCSIGNACPILRADILKVGHHGSDSSSGEEFIGIVNPQTAIISVGKNKYGHPSLRVLRKLERSGAKILRMDKIGDVTKY